MKIQQPKKGQNQKCASSYNNVWVITSLVRYVNFDLQIKSGYVYIVDSTTRYICATVNIEAPRRMRCLRHLKHVQIRKVSYMKQYVVDSYLFSYNKIMTVSHTEYYFLIIVTYHPTISFHVPLIFFTRSKHTQTSIYDFTMYMCYRPNLNDHYLLCYHF